MLSMMGGNHLYNLHELHRASVAPLTALATACKEYHNSPFSPLFYTGYGRKLAAGWELVERITQHYGKPEFGITETVIDGKTWPVNEEVIDARPFCRLLHFEKPGRAHDPKLLIVAPMSGHYATLLRGTVEAMLPTCDVYITDWSNAREVPLHHGPFDLDDYVDHVIEYIRLLAPDVHLMAVCQPSVPVMAAVSIMASENDPARARSMTLIGGPIDTRVNPTKVNRLATEKPPSWFENNVIMRVPFNHPGYMRRVYPGFVQLTGFMTMNLDRHIDAHAKLYQHLVEGDGDSAEKHREFYDEYLSVADIPAEFYLQTIDTAFQRHLLPKGEWESRGRKVDPHAITDTALLTIEGELDDISGVGQTEAAHRLCSNIPPNMRKHHLQMGTGHYGIFNGRKFREQIVPMITAHINASNGPRGSKNIYVATGNKPSGGRKGGTKRA